MKAIYSVLTVRKITLFIEHLFIILRQSHFDTRGIYWKKWVSITSMFAIRPKSIECIHNLSWPQLRSLILPSIPFKWNQTRLRHLKCPTNKTTVNQVGDRFPIRAQILSHLLCLSSSILLFYCEILVNCLSAMWPFRCLTQRNMENYNCSWATVQVWSESIF